MNRTTSNPLHKPSVPGSPVKPLGHTNSKLQAFSFATMDPANSRTRDPHKENRVDDGKRNLASPGKNQDVQKTPRPSQFKALPSTPAMRLPLADLVGNAEEALRRRNEDEEHSPEENVGWIANSSHPDLTPRQRRQRAQSSSPLTSSQERAEDQFALGDLDLKNMQHNLKTPRTISDPAAELWSRYATGNNADDSEDPLPSFAHLIENSSPRSAPRTPGGSVGGLRRWASCGMDWPASKVKRRRTHGVFRDKNDNNMNQEDEPQSNNERPVSRVGMLLEKVQASLAQPSRLRPDAPSSSSPLPHKVDLPHPNTAASASPLANLRLSAHALQNEPFSQRSNRSVGSHRGREADFSEFADDDFDMDLAETVVAPAPKPQVKALSRHSSRVMAPFKPVIPRQPLQPAPAESGHVQQQPIPSRVQDFPPNKANVRMEVIDEEELDEFGDDLDISLEDIDNAVTIFDSRSSSRPASNMPSAAPSRSTSLNQTMANTNQTSRPNSVISANSAHSIAVPPGQPVHDLTGFPDDEDNNNNDNDDNDDDDDEFGGSDLDDESFAQVELSATQAANQASTAMSNSHSRKSRAIQRYLVKQVIDGQYTDDKGRTMFEKVLLVEDESEKSAKAITLRQSWTDTHCTASSFVHVVGNFGSTGQITIDDANNLLIVHPDHLISATVVADSFECIRRAVLQDRVKATSSTNEPNVYGTILHEVFQEAMKANRWDPHWLAQLVETTLSKFLEKLFELGHDGTGKALEHLRSKIPELSSWAGAFVRANPGPDGLADDRNGKKIRMSITKLLDVEEHVWSPTYGLKGNIDATVQVMMQDEVGERALTVPFEVKTGRNTSNTSHRAQTALYTLLLSDRYDLDVIYGVLYYMETSVVTRIPAIRNELRHMIMQRNELASYVRERLQLPPMLQNPHKCGRCYAKTSCFLYHKLAEGGTAETAGVKENFDELVGKLKPAHQDFFKKWDNLLTKEESEMMKFRRELWTMLSKEREKLGRCFSEVVIEPGSGHENDNMAKINRFSYTFVKKEATPGFSFTESQITVGEPIVISSEQGHFALANGYVTKVSRRRISVAVDRRLHNARKKLPGFNSRTNQTFVGIMEVSKEDDGVDVGVTADETIYRLDKDEFSNGMATVRNNLLSIMDDSVYQSRNLRSLIVEDTPPAFKPSPSAYNVSSLGQMNPDQRAAIDKVMSAKDYALVLGMPGTGKTTTIAQIIRALVNRGKSVLLTSYTHTAVDNILLKLRSPKGQKQEMSILRLGTLAKIHPEVGDFATLAATPKHSLEEIEASYMTPQVVATTCLGVSHFLFQKRVFDYCIVDEASQITLPVCLGPIRMARTFVLVGDHYQLPPLVQNKDAAEGGLDVSLFKLLSDGHPEAVVELGRQYRMCEDVQSLANTLVYDGRLKCGNEDVANRTLTLPHPEGLDRFHQPDPLSSCSGATASCPGLLPSWPSPTTSVPEKQACWLQTLLHPARKVLFANTDTMLPYPPRETAQGRRIVNATEAQLIAQLVLALLSSGVPATEIGVITFYRSQLALLKQTLRAYASALSSSSACSIGAGAGGPGTAGAAGFPIEQVEMHTADKFQGRDKEIVLVSCVRSNEASNIGDLLRDWRRVNVAVTRARSKLVMVGSVATLRGSGAGCGDGARNGDAAAAAAGMAEPDAATGASPKAGNGILGSLMLLLDQKNWIVPLPAGAEASHGLGMCGSGATAMGVSTQEHDRHLHYKTTRGGDAAGDIDARAATPASAKMEMRKALSLRKGIENFLAPPPGSGKRRPGGGKNTAPASASWAGEEFEDIDMEDIDFDAIPDVYAKNKRKHTPVKMPGKVGRNRLTLADGEGEDEEEATRARVLGRGSLLLSDIVNDALGD